MRPPLDADTVENRRLSLEEWRDLDEDEPGELVDGLLQEEEVPDPAHELVVPWLAALLRAWAVPRGGIVLGSDAKLAVGPARGRKPDLSVFVENASRVPRHGLVRVPPDIAVEVLSRAARDRKRDRVEKLADYAAFGIRSYWLVDPEARTLEILALAPSGPGSVTAAASRGTLAVPSFDGLSINLDALWSEVDRLAGDGEDREGAG